MSTSNKVFLLPGVTPFVGMGVGKLAIAGATMGITVTVAKNTLVNINNNNNRGSNIFNVDHQLEKLVLNLNEGISLNELIQLRQSQSF